MLTGPDDEQLEPRLRVQGVQQLAPLVQAEVAGVAGAVGQGRGVSDALHHVDELPGASLLKDGSRQAAILAGQLGRLLARLRLVHDGALDPQCLTWPDGAGADPHPGDAPHDGGAFAARQPADLLDRGQRADRGIAAVRARY